MNKLILKGCAVGTVIAVAGCGQIESGEAGFFTEWGEVLK